LIIRATSPDKKGKQKNEILLFFCSILFYHLDFIYQEAFLTTYRTFISPNELVEKLLQRYTFFIQFETKKKIARYAFSLLVRVIDEIEYEIL